MKVFNATDPGQVAPFREIRRQWRTQLEEGNFFAEGEQVLLRLLQSEIQVLSLLITSEYFERWKDLIASRKDPDVWIAEKQWMEENTGQKLNQGCLALGKVPGPPLLEDLIRSGRCCFVALDGIDHAVNVGAILRNCAAFGVTAVFADVTSVHPYSLRSIRSSLGGVFHVPIYVGQSISEFLSTLRGHQVESLAADPEGSLLITEIDFSKSCCLIFGNEHEGISEEVLKQCSARVAIPVSGKVDSLNVAAASAIFLQRASLRSS